MEVLVLATQRADLGLAAVGQQQEGVVVEQVRNGVLVVLKVLIKRLTQVLVDVLAFDEQQRDTVDEADDVRPAPVQLALDPELTHGQEVVVLRGLEVEHAQGAGFQRAVGIAVADLHPVAEKPILLAVGRHAAQAGAHLHDLAQGIPVGGVGQAGIQRDQFLAQDAGQHYLLLALAPEAAFRAQNLGVVRKLAAPTQRIAQVVGGGLLDQRVFVQRHAEAPYAQPIKPPGRR